MSEGQVKLASTTSSDEELLSALGAGATLTAESEAATAKQSEGPQPAEAAQPAQPQHDGKARSSYQKRIDVLTRRAKEAERQAAELRTKYESNGNGTSTAESVNGVRQSVEAQPQRESFVNANGAAQSAEQDSQARADALVDFVRQLPNGAAIEDYLASHGAAFEELSKSPAPDAIARINELGEFLQAADFSQRTQQALERLPDAKQLQEAASRIHIPTSIAPAITRLENGPEVGIYLARHPEICEQLCAMHPSMAVTEIGRISARLESNGARRPSYSAPPPPINPVRGSSTRSSVPLEELPFSEFRAKRNAPEAVRERARKGYSI